MLGQEGTEPGQDSDWSPEGPAALWRFPPSVPSYPLLNLSHLLGSLPAPPPTRSTSCSR